MCNSTNCLDQLLYISLLFHDFLQMHCSIVFIQIIRTIIFHFSFSFIVVWYHLQLFLCKNENKRKDIPYDIVSIRGVAYEPVCWISTYTTHVDTVHVCRVLEIWRMPRDMRQTQQFEVCSAVKLIEGKAP